MTPSTTIGSAARPIGSSISAIHASPRCATFLSLICLLQWAELLLGEAPALDQPVVARRFGDDSRIRDIPGRSCGRDWTAPGSHGCDSQALAQPPKLLRAHARPSQ